MSTRGFWIDHFPGNFLWSNAALACKGMAPYGVVAMDEIDRIAERLKPRQGEPQAWQEEWCAMAARVERVADDAAKQGCDRTAGNYYMRAGNYYYTGERFIPPGEAKIEVGRKAYRCYRAGLTRCYPNIEFVEVPYGQATLPALFLRAPGVPDRAPTVVIFNGMDNCKEMSVIFAGLEFAKRGMHTLAIDGPGQGETLRFRGIHSRHDYEVPGTAAYEYVAQRTDVDPARVVIMGYSFGGYYSARIAAFEQRYAAGVSMTALHWDLAAWQIRIKEKAQAEGTKVAQSNFQFQWVVGAADADGGIEVAKRFRLQEVAPQITMPYLVTHGANDRVVPVENAQKLYDALGSTQKLLRIFTAEDGGAEHAHVDNRQVGIDFVADWIALNLPA
ncbi:MAG: alpha/beta fold hydrolase [Betaproteobacteria bacterium]|nr:alpha/beta fold hydrolase [Betaproteobacteria bacterium]MDH4294513.1 alpha/beta fold hydrolase [Betaproteobacteria bacterium]MDH5343413.1 alpha/beta fold hydrolase [Betaproteobacteria bacterium]